MAVTPPSERTSATVAREASCCSRRCSANNKVYLLAIPLVMILCLVAWFVPVFPVAAYVSGNGENRVTIHRSLSKVCARFETDNLYDTPHTVCVRHLIYDREVSIDFSWSRFVNGRFKPVSADRYQDIVGAHLRILKDSQVLLDHYESFFEVIDEIDFSQIGQSLSK